MCEKRNPLSNLLAYRTVPVAIGWVECLVIAIGTPSPAHLSVTVRAGKAGINGYLLYLVAEDATQVGSEFVIIEMSLVHIVKVRTKGQKRERAAVFFCNSRFYWLLLALLAEFTWCLACKTFIVAREIGLAGEIILIGKFLYTLRCIR